MTDRIHMLTVALERDIREDDIEVLINAIKMLRGVSAVETHVTEPSDWSARERIAAESHQKLQRCLWEVLKGAPFPGEKPILRQDA